MSHFTKRTEVTASFDKGDVATVSVGVNSYNNAITVNTRNDETISLKFANAKELKAFTEALIDAALAIDWDKDYDNEHRYMNDDSKERITVENLLAWKKDSARVASSAEDLG
jgi:hypothetical protein